MVGLGYYQGVGEKGWATLGLLRSLCPSQRAPGCGSRALRFHNADVLPGRALSRGVWDPLQVLYSKGSDPAQQQHDRGGHDRGGYDRGGYDRGGYDRGGYGREPSYGRGRGYGGGGGRGGRGGRCAGGCGACLERVGACVCWWVGLRRGLWRAGARQGAP